VAGGAQVLDVLVHWWFVCTRRGQGLLTSECSTKALSNPLQRANQWLNGFAIKCSFEVVNVFDWLQAQTVAKPHEKAGAQMGLDHS